MPHFLASDKCGSLQTDIEHPCLLRAAMSCEILSAIGHENQTDQLLTTLNTLETKDLHYSLMKKIMMTDSFSCLSD